jgi:two-component system NtrC family sensor kinase
MSNALDAIKGGQGTSLAVHAARTEPGWMTLTFTDDGPGFREPERVFDPFYTTKLAGAGTGLGLTVVHRFVTEAGGTIQATNVAPHGACVAIRLRTVDAPALVAPEHINARPRASRLPMVAEALTAESQSVLVVDDEPSLRSVQERLLRKMGLRVTVAASGAEAKAMIGLERFDVVVTDIRMPGELDGIALYHWIKATQPDLAERCLFVSGDLADTLRESSLRELADRLISKPFTRDDYVARVQEMLSRADQAATPGD